MSKRATERVLHLKHVLSYNLGSFLQACHHLKQHCFKPCAIWSCDNQICCAKHLTRFNKIAIPNIKFQMANGQGSHWFIESPTITYLSILVLNIFTLLALTQSFGSLFHSFITLCEKEYFFMSNLHCSLTNVALCPLVLLPSLCHHALLMYVGYISRHRLGSTPSGISPSLSNSNKFETKVS